jgi:hypothetical protein
MRVRNVSKTINPRGRMLFPYRPGGLRLSSPILKFSTALAVITYYTTCENSATIR